MSKTKQNLGEVIDLDQWFKQIWPLMDHETLKNSVEPFIKDLRNKGLENQEIFCVCYNIAREALRLDFETR